MNNTNPQIISVFFIGILLTVSCLNNTQEIRETKLSYDKLVTGWNDSIFIRMCQGLSFFDGRYYISNTEKGYVLACDENLNFVKKIGSKGKGPGEIAEPYWTLKFRDHLYIEDGANNKVLKIDDQQQISNELILPEGWGYRTRFAVDQKGRIYVPTPYGKYPITVLDDKGQIQRFIGKEIDAAKKMEDRHLFISPSNELIAISPTEAFIEKYSLDGQLVERVELGELDLFKDIIYTMEEEVKRVSAVSNLFAPIIRDVSLQDNYLFLLFNNVPEGSLQRDHIFSNQIMKINLNKLQENMEIFELSTDNAKPRFSKIAVSSDGESLLAFERSNFEFYRYSLK